MAKILVGSIAGKFGAVISRLAQIPGFRFVQTVGCISLSDCESGKLKSFLLRKIGYIMIETVSVPLVQIMLNRMWDWIQGYNSENEFQVKR